MLDIMVLSGDCFVVTSPLRWNNRVLDRINAFGVVCAAPLTRCYEKKRSQLHMNGTKIADDNF